MLETLLLGGSKKPLIFKPAAGQLLFTVAGTYIVEVDTAVANVSMVVVSAAYRGGAGLGYRNSVNLPKGTILEIIVGGLSDTEMLSQVKAGSTIICRAYGPTGTKFEIGGVGGKSALTANTGGGNGGDALYNGAFNRGKGGAGGYSGNGGNSSYVSSDGNWTQITSPTSGTGGGGGGGAFAKIGNSSYDGVGGGVSLTPPNGTLLNGASGIWSSTSNTSTRHGGRGSHTNATTRSLTYGGGSSSRTPGAVRLMWGSGRSYPNSNTADV